MADRLKLSVEDYLAEVSALVAPVADAEDVPLVEAIGRTLAEPVTSRVDIPTFTNSAMDGFAVRHDTVQVGDDVPEVADVPAGSEEDPALGAGQCVRIMTGAPVPTEADTIIPRELVDELDGGIRINELPAKGRHVRHAGEDLQAGAVVLATGAVLGPHELALAASCGVPTVRVVRHPRVVVVATGDELRAPGEELQRGQLYESNRFHLGLCANRDGAEVVASVVLPDDPEEFAAGLDEAVAAGADLVVMSGGVSVGDHDVARIVLSDRAEGTFRHVHMQPGKPQGWAWWQGVPVVALPGNPLSAAVSYELFVRPLIERMLGRAPRAWVPAVVAEGWTPPARRQFIPVVVDVDAEGRRCVRPAHVRGSASHMVSVLTRADALADVPAETPGVNPGDVVMIRSLR